MRRHLLLSTTVQNRFDGIIVALCFCDSPNNTTSMLSVMRLKMICWGSRAHHRSSFVWWNCHLVFVSINPGRFRKEFCSFGSFERILRYVIIYLAIWTALKLNMENSKKGGLNVYKRLLVALFLHLKACCSYLLVDLCVPPEYWSCFLFVVLGSPHKNLQLVVSEYWVTEHVFCRKWWDWLKLNLGGSPDATKTKNKRL